MTVDIEFLDEGHCIDRQGTTLVPRHGAPGAERFPVLQDWHDPSHLRHELHSRRNDCNPVTSFGKRDQRMWLGAFQYAARLEMSNAAGGIEELSGPEVATQQQ